MKISISKNKIAGFIRIFAITLFLFSSTCFWEESSLNLLLGSGIVVVLLTLFLMLYLKIDLKAIVNCKAVWWIIFNFTIYEVYGFMFLRAGSFNWDFVGFNGILLICITILCISVECADDFVNMIVASCKLGIIATAIYMFQKGDISFTNITFGTRLGDSLSGNVNTVATCFAVMYLPVFYSVAVKEKRNIFGIGCCLLALVCMLITGSKKSFLVVALSFFMAMILYKKPAKYIIFPAIIIAGIYAIFTVPIFYNTIGFRIIDMFASFGFGTAVTRSQSTSARNELILMGLKSFWKHPILGGGMNYFQYINHTRYYAHNNFIEIMNNFGAVGLVAFYGISVKAFAVLLKFKNLYQDKANICILCLSMIFMKYLLDMAMVSYSSLGIYYLPFLFPIMFLYNEGRSLHLNTLNNN